MAPADIRCKCGFAGVPGSPRRRTTSSGSKSSRRTSDGPQPLRGFVLTVAEENREDRLDALFRARSGRVDHQTLPVPGTIVPLRHVRPGRQRVPRDLRLAEFHATPVLLEIRTD